MWRCVSNRVARHILALPCAVGLICGCEAERGSAPQPTPSAAPAADLEASLDRLEAAVVARLLLAPEVARTKYASGRPVLDPSREATVISEFTQQAHQLRVPGWLAENVIRGQLEASRFWQQTLLDQWQKSPPEEIVPRDLVTEIRPEIDRATAELAACLAAIPIDNVQWTATLRVRVELGKGRPETMPERVWWLAWQPLVGPRTPVSQRRITVEHRRGSPGPAVAIACAGTPSR